MNRVNLEWLIATNNVTQFRTQLESPADESQRKVLEFLLKRELAKLAAFKTKPGQMCSGRGNHGAIEAQKFTTQKSTLHL